MAEEQYRSKKQLSTGQLKKLFYTKKHSDVYGAVWKPSTWKVLAWLMFIFIVLILIYSLFVEDQISFFQSIVFYSIITVLVVAIVWVAVNVLNKSRKIFVGFVLAWILILGVYIIAGFIVSLVGLMEFHYGFTTWVVITFLALIGSKRIDGNIDRNDVGFGLLVLFIIIIGNVPIFEVGGFLAQVDTMISFITDRLMLIDPQGLIAE